MSVLHGKPGNNVYQDFLNLWEKYRAGCQWIQNKIESSGNESVKKDIRDLEIKIKAPLKSFAMRLTNEQREEFLRK
jgi:hypothetical protein